MEENKVLEEKKFNMKVPIMIIAIVAVVLVGIVAIVMGGKGSSKPDTVSIPHDPIIDSNGTAFFGTGDKFMSISGDAESGWMTKDEKHYVLLDKDSSLNFYDAKGENKEKIDNGVSSILYVQDSGVIYTKEEIVEPLVEDILQAIVDDYVGTIKNVTIINVRKLFKEYSSTQTLKDAKILYMAFMDKAYISDKTSDRIFRYTFADKESIDLGIGTCRPAHKTLSLVFENSENIYTLAEDATELVQLTTITTGSEAKLLDISNDGKIVAWTEKKDGIKTIYISEDSEKSKVGEMDFSDSYSDYINSHFINDDSELVIYSTYSSQLLWKKKGEDTATIEFGAEIKTSSAYTAKDSIYGENDNVNELYIGVESDEKGSDNLHLENLYYVDATGEKEKVLSNVAYVSAVVDGTIYYIDKDGTFNYAQLNKKEISDGTKISSDVYKFSIRVSSNNKTVYFGKNYDEDTKKYSLYSYQPSKSAKEPEKIATDVAQINLSEDGQIISYLANTTKISDTDFVSGDLYTKKTGKEATKVSSDVVYILFQLSHTRTNKNGLNFYKFDSKKEDGYISVDYYFYNWKEATKLISGATYKR